ncbi:MAG: TetR/AcrR family transcriptional regulator [Bacilli bacterium]|nr:TetR/AcrR family transcriptional regulator [Bacilli bacterium]
MPPIKKFDKEAIISVAYDIAKKEGFEGINARRIASILGCSVQPIFHNFTSMEELNKEVYNRIYNKYKEYMTNARKNPTNPYKEMGLAYIRFAANYPEFFKIIFMQHTNLSAENLITNDDMGNDVIKAGMELTGLTFEEQKSLHVRVWIFTHGIACLVATKSVEFKDNEITSLLEESVRQMVIGYKYESGEKK